MAVYIYSNNKFHLLAGNKIVKNDEFIKLKNEDTMFFNNKRFPLGVDIEQIFPNIPDIVIPELIFSQDLYEPTGHTIYVSPGGRGLRDGSSWDNAGSNEIIPKLFFMTNPGDNVFFSEGEYNITSTIKIKSDVNFYGGFKISEEKWETRNSFENQTKFIQSHDISLFDISESSINQTIDGFVLLNPIDMIPNDAEKVIFKNMIISGGNFEGSKLIINSKIINCNLKSTNANNIVILNDNYSKTNIDNIINSTFDRTNIICKNIENSNIYRSGIIVSNDVKNCIIQDTDTIRLYEIGHDLIDSDVYGNINVENNIIKSNIYGNAIVKNNCISDDKNKNVITGFLNSKNISNYILYDYVNISEKAIQCDFVDKNKGYNKLWKTDDSIPCNYHIYHDKLYYKNEIATDLMGWTFITGMSDISGNYAYGICNGELYSLYLKEITKLSKSNKWTNICGYSKLNSYYAYGICDGYLFLLNEKNINKISDIKGWTNISGLSSDEFYAYGICNGELYSFHNDVITKIGNSNKWKKISGLSSNYYAYGICDGELYSLNKNNVIKVKVETGYEKGWSDISGYSYYNDRYAYAICNNELFVLNKYNSTKIENIKGWTKICGFSFKSYKDHYAYGICNGKLYCLQNFIIEEIPGSNKWTDICGYSYSESYDAYGICDGELFIFNKNEILRKENDTIQFSEKCRFINKSYQYVENSINSVFINSKSTVLSSNSNFCTFIKCAGDVLSGINNIYWNCDGKISPKNNAISENIKDGIYISTTNDITKFNYIGIYEKGFQDSIEKCPYFTKNKKGYRNWVLNFGDFHLKIDSLLKGQGIHDEFVKFDFDNVERPNPPTIGAYEPNNF